MNLFEFLHFYKLFLSFSFYKIFHLGLVQNLLDKPLSEFFILQIFSSQFSRRFNPKKKLLNQIKFSWHFLSFFLFTNFFEFFILQIFSNSNNARYLLLSAVFYQHHSQFRSLTWSTECGVENQIKFSWHFLSFSLLQFFFISVSSCFTFHFTKFFPSRFRFSRKNFKIHTNKI